MGLAFSLATTSLPLLAEPRDAEPHFVARAQIHRRLLPWPTPGGVPVEMMSPGCRLMNLLR